MAKERDFIDYANTAANAVQVAQLNSINSKMQQMAGAMAEKEYREQQEAAVSRCEDTLREAVFFYVEKLRDIEAIPGQTPSEIYIRVSYLRGTYEKMPEFKTSGFRQYEDKERLSGIQRAYEKVIRETGQKMDAEELDLCNRCVQHIFDRHELLRLISFQQKREALEREQSGLSVLQADREKKLQTLTGELNAGTPVWHKIVIAVWVVSVVLTIGAAVCLGFEICVYGERYLDNADRNSFLLLMLTMLISCVIAGITPTLLSRSKISKRRKVLKQEATEIKRCLDAHPRELVLRVSCVDSKAGPLYAKFGTNTSEGYQEMLRERDQLLELKLGTYTGEYTKRTLSDSDGAGQTELFDLNIINAPFIKKSEVIKVVCELKKVGILGGSDAIKKIPCTLLSNMSKAEADSAASKLGNAGAVVEVVPVW